MAFFKLRKGGDESPPAPDQPETVEGMRRRARHRLIGAAVLVLAGVVGFPILFDTQPRPVAVDIPIDIPDRNKAKPLPVPAVAAAASPAASATPAPAPPAAKIEEKPAQAQIPPAQAAIKTEAKTEAAAVPVQSPKSELKSDPKAAASAGDAAKARALLEGKPAAASASDVTAAGGRFVVQVGAFADATKARETRLKVEKAGLKTYTHVAETKEGKRIRVRVGPFATRADADKAADRVKGLDLPAAILTL